MPYQINRYNGSPLVTVDEGTLNNSSTTIQLIGKNYAGYGDIQNENFVYLMENFSNTAAPPNALSGQIWYDSANRKLKFWDALHWRTTGGAEIGPTEPPGLTTGDFWWNTDSNQLYAFDGISKFVLIGPQAVAGLGITQWESVSVLDDQNNKHAIMEAFINDKIEFIISKDTFNLNETVNPIVGFGTIHAGMTIVDANNSSGVSTNGDRYWGTASSADGMLDATTSTFHAAHEYVLAQDSVFYGTSQFDTNGFTVGGINQTLSVGIVSSIPTIQNTQSNNIIFKIKDGTIVKETMQILGSAVDPGLTDTYDLGEPLLRWRNIYAKDIYADNFHGGNFIGNVVGTSDRAKTLYFDYANGTPPNPADLTKYVVSTATNTNNTIVARDNNGNFAAGTIDAIATRAQYADLAEKYEADNVYEPGTVVVFGGNKEITLTMKLADSRVAGVISTNPAYLMNDSGETADYLPVALRGKVPVKVVGPVHKGDVLVTSSNPGYAVSIGDGVGYPHTSVFAKSIEDKVDSDPGVVMAVIL